MLMLDSMPVEEVEDGLCLCYMPLGISSVSDEMRFPIHANLLGLS
jgi:hypothetical protein